MNGGQLNNLLLRSLLILMTTIFMSRNSLTKALETIKHRSERYYNSSQTEKGFQGATVVFAECSREAGKGGQNVITLHSHYRP